jgi:hypothetical protein
MSVHPTVGPRRDDTSFNWAGWPSLPAAEVLMAYFSHY